MSNASNGGGLMSPGAKPGQQKQKEKIKVKKDGLMERTEDQVLTDDGRELLK